MKTLNARSDVVETILTPTLTLAMPQWAIALLVVGFLFVCVLLILIVLIQRPQGGGLSGAFGASSGSGQTAFGARTGDALTIATISIFVLYLLVAVGLNWAITPPQAPRDATVAADGTGVVGDVTTQTVPATPPAEGDGDGPPEPEPDVLDEGAPPLEALDPAAAPPPDLVDTDAPSDTPAPDDAAPDEDTPPPGESR